GGAERRRGGAVVVVGGEGAADPRGGVVVFPPAVMRVVGVLLRVQHRGGEDGAGEVPCARFRLDGLQVNLRVLGEELVDRRQLRREQAEVAAGQLARRRGRRERQGQRQGGEGAGSGTHRQSA